jgi:hypothetical protein
LLDQCIYVLYNQTLLQKHDYIFHKQWVFKFFLGCELSFSWV